MLGVGRVADRTHDGDSPGAGGDDVGDVRFVDPADREPRDARVPCGVADVVEPGGGASLLRRRGIHRPDAGVVGHGPVELVRGMRRLADRKAKVPRGIDGEVVLADVT